MANGPKRRRKRRTTTEPSNTSIFPEDATSRTSTKVSSKTTDRTLPATAKTWNMNDDYLHRMTLQELLHADPRPDRDRVLGSLLQDHSSGSSEDSTEASKTNNNNRVAGSRTEYVDPRDDTAGFAEDAQESGRSPQRTWSDTRGPPRPPDLPQLAKNWHPARYPKEPMISFWPVGILVMAVFIVGLVAMFLCRAVSAAPDFRTRRASAGPARPAAARSPRAGRRRARREASDDEGGFADPGRRRIAAPGASAGDPPRAVTPPPPYPGPPYPGPPTELPSVYVNPLHAKPSHRPPATGVTRAGRAPRGAQASTLEEQPPPYPGL